MNENNRRKDQRRPPKRLTAIDFDSRCMHVAHAERNGAGPKMLKTASVPLPGDLNASDPLALGKFIAAAMESLKLAGSTSVLCLPRSKVTLKQLHMPPDVTSDEISSIVMLQMQDDLPFGQDGTIIDHVVLGAAQAPPPVQPAGNGKEAQDKPVAENVKSEHLPDSSAGPAATNAAALQDGQAHAPKPGLDVLVAATGRETIKFYTAAAETAGLKLWSLGLRPLYDAFAAISCPAIKGYDCAVLLHIMADEAEISVVEHGKLCFSRSAVIKSPVHPSDGQMPDEQLIGQLILETVRSLQAFQAQSPQSNPGIILTAGNAQIEPLLRQALAKKLGIRCEGLEPRVSGLPAGEEQLARVSVIGGATACLSGAATNAVGPRDDLFDFTCPKRPPEIRDLRRVKMFAAAAAVLLVILGSVLAGHMYLSAKQDKVIRLQNQYNDLAKANKVVKAIRKNLTAVEEWNASQRDWLDHIAYLSGLFPSCKDMYISNLRTESDNQISFLVQSRSGDAITEFGRKLSAYGYEFKPGAITTGRDDLGYTYRSQCRVTIPAKLKLELASIRWEPRPADDSRPGEIQRPSYERPTGGYRPSFTPPTQTQTPTPTPETQKAATEKPKEEPPKQGPPSGFRSYRRTR